MLPIENENKTPKHKKDHHNHNHNHHSHHHNHEHNHEHHTHDHTKDIDLSEQNLSPPATDKWSSLLKLQTIVITKPKKEKQRRSTFSFFGNSGNKILPIDESSNLKNHPIGDAMIPSNTEDNKNHSNDKKKNKKRRYSV